MISFRDEFNQMIDDYGHYVLMQRTGRTIRCSCWNEKYQEADSKCPICLGTGWVVRIERHKVRQKLVFQIQPQTNLYQQTDIGKMRVGAYTYYMRHDAHPQIGDFIYQVGWSGHRPVGLDEAFQINDVNPIRGDNGRIEYYQVAAKTQTFDLDFKKIIVRSVGPIKNYEIIK